MASKDQPFKCAFCKRGHEATPVCGPLHTHTHECSAHHKCMQYSALLTQYKFSSFGGFKIDKVVQEIKRGRFAKCALCRGKKKSSFTGATCGCAIKSCRKTFHYYCAHEDPNAITKRLEVTKDNGQKVILYRVFCGKDHQRLYESNTNNKIEYVSDSDPEGGEDEEVDVHLQLTQSSQESNSRSASVPSTPVKSTASVQPMMSSPNRFKSSPQAPPTNPAIMISAFNRTLSSETNSSSDDADEGSSTGTKRKKRRKVSTIVQKKRTIGTLTPFKGKKDSTASSDTDYAAGGDASTKTSPAKTPVKITYEPIFELRTQANPEDCIIVFPEQPLNTTNKSALLQQMAKDLYGVPNSSVYFWQYSSESDTLTNDHMVYLHKDISCALSQADLAKLQKLVFDLSDKDVVEYTNLVKFNNDLGDDLRKRVVKRVRDTIQSNFVHTEAFMKDDIGCVKHTPTLEGDVLFLRVCQVIDPGHVIRSRLGHQADLVQWDENTTLCEFPLDSIAHYQAHEKTVFLKWLGKHVSQPQILTFPTEAIFLSKNKMSTTYRLMKDYQKKPSMSQSNNILVFLGPVDEEMVNFSTYVKKMLPQLIETRLTQPFIEIYCVLDVHSYTGIYSYNDIVANIPANIRVQCCSAQDPSRLPVSAVLLHISFKKE